jgi:hypothetical protein
MTPENLFSVCNGLALIGWVLLVFLPRWKWTMRIVLSGALPALLAVVYLTLIVTTFGKAEGGFGSLAEVSKLFRNDWVLLAGWVHYLVFDLFVGSWETRDAQRLGVPHWLLVPCLALTFLFGPIGFLAYRLARLTKRVKGES